MKVFTYRLRELSSKAQAGLTATVLALSATLPLLVSGTASATPTLLQRQLTSTTGRPSQTTQLAWTFNTTSDVANIKQISIEFCDQPLSTCSNVSGTSNIPTIAASPTATLTNFTSNTVTSTTRVGGLGGGTNNQINVVKTNADAGASLSGATIQLAATDITNNAAVNKSYYTRVRVYSDTGTTLVWQGVFAQSTSQTLTVNARVQERLDFCVGSTAVDDATTSVAANCTAVTGTTVDIGSLDSGHINISPVTATNGGTAVNGVAMIRTNAVNGAVVSYKSVQDTSSGALKITGATCNAVPSTSNTDQCFNDSSTKGTFTAGTEKFGMTIAAVNCVATAAYACTFAGGTYNLARDPAYNGTGANTYPTTDKDQITGTSAAGYAWQSSGAATTIASSAASTVKVIDNEALILKFAATPAITTPTGSYTVQADYIATATF